MSINHQEGDAVAALKSALRQPNRPNALAHCTYPGAAQLAGTNRIRYTAETPGWIVFCLVSVSGQVQLVIEARHGSLKQTCETVWQAFRAEAAALSPCLDRLEVIDPAGTEPIARARTGVRPLLRSVNFQLALGPGVLTAVVIGVCLISGLLDDARTELILGGAPALIVAVVAALLVVVAARRRSLVWEG
jgi:hypothetical protein